MTIEVTQAYINGAMLILASLTLLFLRRKYINELVYVEHKSIIDTIIFPFVLFFIWIALTAFINPIYYIKYL